MALAIFFDICSSEEEKDTCRKIAYENYNDIPYLATIGNVITRGWSSSTKNRFQEAIIHLAIGEGLFDLPDEIITLGGDTGRGKKEMMMMEEEEDEEEEQRRRPELEKKISSSESNRELVNEYLWDVNNREYVNGYWDQQIVEFIWKRLGVREHFQQTLNHRKYISTFWKLLRERVKTSTSMSSSPPPRHSLISAETLALGDLLVKVHDVRKYQLEQAIGYALKFVLNMDNNPVSDASIQNHLSTEPHHVEFWKNDNNDNNNNNNNNNSERKIESWLNDLPFVSTEFRNELSTRFSAALKKKRLTSTGGGGGGGDDDDNNKEVPTVFLLEMIVDQLARYWEKKLPNQTTLVDVIGNGDNISIGDIFNIEYTIPRESMIMSGDFFSLVNFLKKNLPDLLLFKRHSKGAFPPIKGSKGAAGYDLRSAYDYCLAPFERGCIETDISVVLPPKTYGRIASRSGLAANHGVFVMTGVIDADYTGKIKVVILNCGKEPIKICPGDRIAQLICERISYPNLLETSSEFSTGVDEDDITEGLSRRERGDKGFGSSGK